MDIDDDRSGSRGPRSWSCRLSRLMLPFAAYNAVGQVGEPWMYFYVLGVALEVIVLAFILRSAWTWPRRTASPATLAASLDSEPLRTPQA